jgi:hypothetical protein
MCKGSTIHTPYLGLKNYFSHPRGTFMIEVALKDRNAKSYSGNHFLCVIPSMSLNTTLFMLSLYVYRLLHCKLTKKYLFQWKKTSFIVIFSGTRQEMKIKKQNKIVSFCCFFSFVCLLSFCEFFWIPHVRAYVFVHFVPKKNKKGFVWKVEEWEIILVGVYHGFAMGHPKIASAWSW